MKKCLLHNKTKVGMNFTMTTLWKRGLFPILALLVNVTLVNAQSLSSDQATYCANDPIILKVDGFASTVKSLDLMQSSDKITWTGVASVEGNSGVFVQDMPSGLIYYKVKDHISSTETNVVRIYENTGSDCASICHTTSTGEYFSGTDFNLSQGCSSVDWSQTPPGCLESYFSEDKIIFKKGGVNGDVKTEWGYTPHLDDSLNVTNSYFVTNSPNSNICELRFPKDIFSDKYYRFTMRTYLVMSGPCQFDPNAKLMTRTGHGTVSQDVLEVEIFDDQNGTSVMKSQSMSQGGVATITVGGQLNNYLQTHPDVRAFRLEMNFYGYFPVYSSDFTLLPYFEQFGLTNGCNMTVAVDYISAESESICMDRGAVCIGQTATVNAAGFPKDAVYKWEVYKNNQWSILNIDGFDMIGKDRSFVNIKLGDGDLGKVDYRVSDANNNKVIIPFSVTGKNCEPLQPTEILGDDKICAPINPDHPILFEVYPADANEFVTYHWSMVTPDGTKIDENLSYTGGLLSPKGKGDTINVTLNATATQGTYILTVQPKIKRITPTGYYIEEAGSPITRTFTVYQTPNVTLEVHDGDGNLKDTLCPSDSTQRIVAIARVNNQPQPSYNYEYLWDERYLTKIPNTDSAIVNLPSGEFCDGTKTQMPISVTVQIKNVGCPTSVIENYRVEESVNPTIDCKSLSYSQLNYELGPQESSVTIDLPLPQVDANCDTNPNWVIDVKIEGDDGSVTFKKFEFTQKEALTFNKKITIPAGKATVNYTITDGCDKSATCSAVITVEDVTPPDINCGQIPSYLNVHLSNQDPNSCEAVPGAYRNELPMLTEPLLVDNNGVDGTIKGVYKGRKYTSIEPQKREDLFDKVTALNANYKVGTTYILWAFTDKSNNTTYCLQKVVVVDDKEPDLNCPANAELGEIGTNMDQCAVSLDSLLVKMPQELIPSASDINCLTGEVIKLITPKMYYRVHDSLDWIELTDPTALIFDKGVVYDLKWRFYKKVTNFYVDGTIYRDCDQTFKVVDKQLPYFDCSALKDVKVMADNYQAFVNVNGGYFTTEYSDFASGGGNKPMMKPEDKNFVNSLKKFFDDGTLSMHDGVTDNCGGVVTVTVVIEDVPEDGELQGTRTVVRRFDPDFLRHKFKVGASTIHYIYSDGTNEDSCEQVVIVVPDNVPQTNCTTLEPNIFVDSDCKAYLSIELSDVPTADVTFNKDVKFMDDESCNKPNVTNQIEFDNLIYRKSLTGPQTVTVYPYGVRVVRFDGTSSYAENVYTTNDTIANQVVQHRMYNPERTCRWENFSTIKVKRENFTEIPAILNEPFTTDDKINQIIWYFENPDGVKDSCVSKFSVIDTISPTVICGDWSKKKTIYADESCVADAALAGLVVPTPNDIQADDNCTAASNLVVTWKRPGFDEAAALALTTPFELGVTTINWIVTDLHWNKAFCPQEIEVIDTLGPKFDCSSLTDIVVYANTECKADPQEAVEAGLIVPETEDDKCSPTGSLIKATGLRSDGLDLFEDFYPLGTTVITWTFEDSLKNKTICQQNIIVNDTSVPIFNCEDLEDVIVDVSPDDACKKDVEVIRAKLGSHTASDNCDISVMGEPWLLDSNSLDLVSLPNEFPQDSIYNIIWVFEDKKHNRKECPQKLIIRDTIPPKTNCPPSEKTVDATVTCSVTYDDLELPSTSSLYVEDACDGDIYPIVVAKIAHNDGTVSTYVEDELQGIYYPVGKHIIYWIYTDKSGLSDTCQMDLTIADKTPPVLVDCDVEKEVFVTVSEENEDCSISPEELKPLIVEPKAYDQCDDEAGGIGRVFIKPVIERWFNGERLNDDGGNPIKWDSLNFPKGTTTIRWIFTDKSGNEAICEKIVHVEDHTAPFFDCSKIDPDTIRPVALPGECVAKFNEIQFNEYNAEDKCTDNVIPGVLTLNGMNLPTDYTMEVGKTYMLTWVFEDNDGNKKTCPQYITPSHQMPINFDCSTLKPIEKLAEEGTCALSAEEVALQFPQTRDTCTKEPIIATGVRSDGKSLIDDYSTGQTIVTWTFVSPYNLDSVKTCEQVVSILGNKKFDIDCETLVSVARDTISDCETSNIGAEIEAPVVGDPCADPESADYNRIGVGYRSDNLGLTDPYPLGVTTIKWIFTDFTGSVKDSCSQDVVIKTDLEIAFNCDSLKNDTVKVNVKEGECTVPADSVKLTFPNAINPCRNVSIEGVPSRAGGLGMDKPYHTGLTKITWTFTDTTGILSNPVFTCDQWVQVGDVNKMPVDCNNMPDTLIKLPENDCDILFSELNFTIPPVYDLCTGEHVDSVVTRASGKALEAPFTVGRDTVFWSYSFEGEEFTCKQIITVKDSMAPDFDCSKLDTLRLPAISGKCYTDLDSVLAQFPNPLPTAIDVCTEQEIQGEYSQEDGSPLPSKIAVGDTLIVKWTFIDTAINLVPKICLQPVIVTGDLEPIFECNSLETINVYIESGCDTVLTPVVIVTPVAEDACTHDPVEGVASRSDGQALFDAYPVGATIITWTFTSPYSTGVKTCYQEVHVYTENMLIFDCETFTNDTIKVDVQKGECAADTSLTTPYALNPCSEYVEQDTVWGVPTRSDGKVITDPFPTGLTKITWTFTDHSKTLRDSVFSCDQFVQVGDVNLIPVDCKNIPDTVFVLDPTDCDINWSEMKFNVPEVQDLCTQIVVEPTFERTSGKEMGAPFTVGIDTVLWHYDFAGQTYTCQQVINVKDSKEPNFDCTTLDTIRMKSLPTECYTIFDSLALALGNPVAKDACDNTIEIPGKATKMDGSPLPEQITVGDTLIVKWTFFNDTINTVPKICEQVVLVTGDKEPIFDCSTLKDTILYLKLDECILPEGRLNLNVPIAKDTCTGDDVPGVAARLDNEPLTAIYPKGTTGLTWTFVSPYSSAVKTCPQNVVVKDTFPPVPSCETLKDTIKVKITSESVSDNSVTAEEAANAGLVVPVVVDPCDGEITAVGTRNDGKSMTDAYPLGKTDIVWTYTDASGNSDTCQQVVLVEDWVLDTLYCPNDLDGKTFSCVDEVPAPYVTFEEFKQAGGMFSNESKIKEGSFSSENTMDGDSCLMNYIRTYKVVDVRSNVITCSETIVVKDDEGPAFDQVIKDTIFLSCTDPIPAAESLTITDNCDPAPMLSYDTISNKSLDPTNCNYYTYDIDRTWTATDRCGNVTKLYQVVRVQDKEDPIIDFPEGWKDTVLSVYRKGCIFEVPDFLDATRSLVSDNCTDLTDIRIWQVPSEGSRINSSMRVWIFVSDLCGNVDSMSHYVLVPSNSSIISLISSNKTLCGSDNNAINLWSQEIRFATGKLTIEAYDGTLIDVPTTFMYDCYRDAISEDNLVYSDNSRTYFSKFYNRDNRIRDSIRNSRINIRKKSQSGLYYFVAMDTLTYCTDTTSAYLTINERPRISIDSDLQKICELNGVDTVDLNTYLNCLNDMGTPITNRGWLLGDAVYNSKDTVYYEDNDKSFIYFAENECGRSTSLDTYAEFCGLAPKTKKDSLDFVGGDTTKYKLLKNEDYKTRDSLLVEVYKRYKSDSIFLLTNPNDPSRIWIGDEVTLMLKTNYDYEQCDWYQVNGKFDRLFATDQDSMEFEFSDPFDEKDERLYWSDKNGNDYITKMPLDTTRYYVTITDFVCPSVSSNVVKVDVMNKIPTAITPYDRDGLNDVFMKGRSVVIFNRYGQKIYEGSDGWDGTSRNELVDPGVYFHQTEMRNGIVVKGTIEVVKFK